MAHPGNLLIGLVAVCVVFWAANSGRADTQSVGQPPKPFLVRTIRPVKAPNYRPRVFGQEKIAGPQTFTTYPAGSFLQLGGPRDGSCGENKTPPPDQYCVNGKEADHGQFDDQFLVDKSAVEAVEALYYKQVQHFRANREVVLFDIPWGYGPTIQSEITQKTTTLKKGTDVGVSVLKGPYYRIDLFDGSNKYSAWAKLSDFDKAEGPLPTARDETYNPNTSESTSAWNYGPDGNGFMWDLAVWFLPRFVVAGFGLAALGYGWRWLIGVLVRRRGL